MGAASPAWEVLRLLRIAGSGWAKKHEWASVLSNSFAKGWDQGKERKFIRFANGTKLIISNSDDQIGLTGLDKPKMN